MKHLLTVRGAWTLFGALLVLWCVLLILTRGYGCGFGFGGIACNGFLDTFSTFNAFFGWMPVLAAFAWASGVSLYRLARRIQRDVERDIERDVQR
ncbi:hypothetical protein E4K72_07320 [Oxalobacteraceae bacterium OM1]|nr:hypothetical protein E4K72_07320 [Oxalobacteraceae bacterium OM1]